MTRKVTLRAAGPVDREELIALMRRASLANPGDREAILAHPEAIDVPLEQLRPTQTCVAELDGVVAGFATVLPRPDGDAELDGLFVDPELWRSGVGRALVQRAMDLARNAGARWLNVVANPHAFEFYHAVGFEDFGTTSTQFGSGALMRLLVSPAAQA